MDLNDEATAMEALARGAALQAHAARARGRGPEWEDGVPYCRECGERIALARVEALPDAETCVVCARALEEDH